MDCAATVSHLGGKSDTERLYYKPITIPSRIHGLNGGYDSTIPAR